MNFWQILLKINSQILSLGMMLWLWENGQAIAQVTLPPVSANACQVIMTNGGFEQPDLTLASPAPHEPFQANIKAYNESNVPGWLSSADNFIELWRTGNTFGVSAYEGQQFVELNAYTNSSLYQDVATTPGSVITWQFAHRGRAGVDTMNLKIGPPGATVVQINPTATTAPLTSFKTDKNAWKLYQGKYTVPAGQTTTRFEYAAISTAGGNVSVGNLIDAVRFGPLCDYGDAKSNYPVLKSNNGAAHVNDGVSFLGSRLGIELDGQPSTSADGDDGIAGDFDQVDDEDGVTFASPLYTGTSASVNAVASTSGYLNAWIDFNQDNDWDDPGEKIFTDRSLNTGTNNLSFTVPTNANLGDTFARFRFSKTTGLNPTGIVVTGEVEDYQVAIASPISPLVGQLIINEVLYAQSGSSAADNDEFIELFNPSGNAINLSGFKLMDGNLLVPATTDPNALDGTVGSITGSQSPYIFPPGTTLQPKQYAVIWIGNQTPEHSAAGAAFQAWLSKSAKLNDIGDDVWLYDASTKVIDYMAYGKNTSTSMGINTRLDPALNLWNNTYEDKLDVAANGQSISLTPNGIDGNTSACWEKTAIATNDPDSAITRCPNFLTTIDSDTLVINANQRITSVGGNNNGRGNLILVKRITNISPNPNNVSFNIAIDDGIANNDDNNPKWNNNYLLGQTNVTGVKPGDEVEYTIYFLSSGDRRVENVKLCDVIPNNMTLVENNFAPNFGMTLVFNGTALPTTPNKNLSNAIGDDEGDFYPPGTNPPVTNLCKKTDPNNPNNLIPVDGSNNLSGALLIQLNTAMPPATAPGTPANSYGLVRFRAKVK
jgi:uncharacterized repeat protein (TIGR01451 family)